MPTRRLVDQRFDGIPGFVMVITKRLDIFIEVFAGSGVVQVSTAMSFCASLTQTPHPHHGHAPEWGSGRVDGSSPNRCYLTPPTAQAGT